ncbi:hypothetical protein CF319_g7670 [Tilletia indica]|nr:hypothetical protein CF319_g7670 [Tilletia indica]
MSTQQTPTGIHTDAPARQLPPFVMAHLNNINNQLSSQTTPVAPAGAANSAVVPTPAAPSTPSAPVPPPTPAAPEAAVAVPAKSKKGKKGKQKQATSAAAANNAAASPSKSKRYLWDSDAVEPGQPTSIAVLVGWVSDANNYARFKGDGGTTQKACAVEIAAAIEKAKCKGARSLSAILEKIRELQTQFSEAERWLDETGQGVLDEAAEQGPEQYETVQKSIMATVYKKCPYYDDLSAVMKDRASTKSTYSHSTGDARDPAVAALLERAQGGQRQADGADSGGSPEVFLPGWENSQTQPSQHGGRGSEGQSVPGGTSGTVGAGGTAERSASANTTSSGAPVGSSGAATQSGSSGAASQSGASGAAAQPGSSGAAAQPGSSSAASNGGRTIGSAKQAAAKAKGKYQLNPTTTASWLLPPSIASTDHNNTDALYSFSLVYGTTAAKRMSEVEKGINSRGEKRLKLEAKMKKIEARSLAFEHISTRAQQLEASGSVMSADRAFRKATEQYRRHMKTFKFFDDDEEDDIEDDPTAETGDSDPADLSENSD